MGICGDLLVYLFRSILSIWSPFGGSKCPVSGECISLTPHTSSAEAPELHSPTRRVPFRRGSRKTVTICFSDHPCTDGDILKKGVARHSPDTSWNTTFLVFSDIGEGYCWTDVRFGPSLLQWTCSRTVKLHAIIMLSLCVCSQYAIKT